MKFNLGLQAVLLRNTFQLGLSYRNMLISFVGGENLHAHTRNCARVVLVTKYPSKLHLLVL